VLARLLPTWRERKALGGAQAGSSGAARPPLRSWGQRILDTLTFPLRAVTLFGGRDRWGLSSLATERFDYVQREVTGYCLDVGCGRHNRFVASILAGHGRGIDVYPFDGLTQEQLMTDPARFPFEDESFDSVTFIADLNHIPEDLRDRELGEAFRCLREDGRVIVTMGNPLAEILVHRAVALYDRLFGTNHDVDAERGIREGEALFLLDSEIKERLVAAGFDGIGKKRFWTQWGLNHLLVAVKRTRQNATRARGELA